MNKDFGVAFNYNIKTNPRDKEVGDSAVVPIICGFLLILLLAGMFMFRHVLGNSEPFLDHYSLKEGEKQSFEIHRGCYVFIAPITTSDAYVGALPQDIVLNDVLTYVPTYKNYDEANTYIGIDADYLKP